MNSKALTAAAIAGVAIGVLSGIPLISALNCLLCAWVWGGGIFAVWLYKRNSGDPSVQSSQGAMMGLVAGVIGGLIAGVLSMALGAGSMETILGQVRTQMADLDPAQREQMQVMLDAMASGALGVVGICINVGIFAIFGLIGGLIGAATIGKPKQLTSGM
jgi:hypothetical protein